MLLPVFLVVSLLWTPQEAVAQPIDAVAALVRDLEKAAATGDSAAVVALGVDDGAAAELAAALTSPTPTRIVIHERDRTEVTSGRHRLLLEVFWERGFEARLATWTVDVAESAETWRIASAARVAHVTGLYRLTLNAATQYDVRNLTVRAPDLSLHLRTGSAFVAETPEGITAVVLLGEGTMRFSPPDPAEQTQVRIFSGSEVLDAPFDAVFIRVRPEDFFHRFPVGTLVAREPSPRDLRRATEVFDDYIGRTLQINLFELSPDRWSITPQPGDLIAEVRTRGMGSLTYTRSRNDAEDITLFDRRRRRNISVYASPEKQAARGRFYNEDDLVDYDVLAYDLDVIITPERSTIQGNARLKVKIRAAATTTLTLRLEEDLVVSGVYSPDFGRMLFLRVVNQNVLIVSLPSAVTHGSELWLSVLYSGPMPSQDLDREAVAVQQDLADLVTLPPEPRYLYSNRGYWYPQSTVTDYATATLAISVPEQYSVIATGRPTGPPAPAPGVTGEGDRRRRRFVFESDLPVRYLACVVSRLREVDSRRMQTESPPEGVDLHVLANPRQVPRARATIGLAAEVFEFYASLVGGAPYSSFTLGFTERATPGGHSPAYFAVVDQPQQSGLSWRDDPVNFDNYPSFFMAHEIAHQWWGQAVGWKNYHEQWLSEGFAQYFATLYAERKLAPGVATTVLRRMRETAIRESSNGPIYLGYRLGHIQADARIFRSLVYNKAAMVLHMLRRLIGDEAFFAGVRTFYSEWQYRKAGTNDLMAVMERVSGRELSRFFDAWVFGQAVPTVRFTYRIESQTVVLRLEQRNPPVPLPISVRLQYRSGRTETILVQTDATVTDHTVQLTEPLRSAVANADHGALVTMVR
ncbi:hypothetical protein BH24ACI5_BH24ACI5_20610 [soil metagenome]